MPGGASDATIKKSRLKGVGLFEETIRAVEGRDMWLKITSCIPTIAVDSPCWWYRTHPGQMNRHAERMYKNYRIVLERSFEKHPEYASLRASSFSYMYADSAWNYFEGNCLPCFGAC